MRSQEELEINKTLMFKKTLRKKSVSKMLKISLKEINKNKTNKIEKLLKNYKIDSLMNNSTSYSTKLRDKNKKLRSKR